MDRKFIIVRHQTSLQGVFTYSLVDEFYNRYPITRAETDWRELQESLGVEVSYQIQLPNERMLEAPSVLQLLDLVRLHCYKVSNPFKIKIKTF